QELLNKVPVASGGPVPALKVDGLAWDKTNSAIKKFQKEFLHFKWPDGRVDPGGKTFQTLSAFDQPAPAQKDPKIQAEADKSQSVAWAMTAQAMLAFYDVLKLGPVPDPLGDKALLELALATHFHLDKQPALQGALLSSIKFNYNRVLTTLASSGTIFQSRNQAEATSDGGVDPKTGAAYPAYTFFNKSINFTASFLQF